MQITEIELYNVLNCKHVILKFPLSGRRSCVYVIQSTTPCDVVALAIQLICNRRYATVSSLYDLSDKLVGGRIIVTFVLSVLKNEEIYLEEESSDSDMPSTSQQAKIRAEKRKARRAKYNYYKIRALRDFHISPELIEYTIDGGTVTYCTVSKFQARFLFTADIVLPRLSGLTYGNYCNGKWMDFLMSDCPEHKQNDLFENFCYLYAERKIKLSHVISKLTSSLLHTSLSLKFSRTTYAIKIFGEIRRLFEFITSSQYTVWFLLPIDNGGYIDIEDTVDEIDFDQMETRIQLKSKKKDKTYILWTVAEPHIQELLLVAIQLSFAYYCQQKIVFLHSLDHLVKQEVFDVFNSALMNKSDLNEENWESKNYIQRIVNACNKIGIMALIELSSGLPIPLTKTIFIECKIEEPSMKWNLRIKQTKHSKEELLAKFIQMINQFV